MKLTKKIILLVGVVCILFSLLYFLLYRSVLAHPITERKHFRARKITGGAQATLQNESKRIRTLTEDWAMWDTMYAFTSNPTPEVLDDFSPQLSVKGSDLSFLAIIDKNKKILHVSGYDQLNGKALDFSRFKDWQGKTSMFLEETFDDIYTRTGLVCSQHGFLLLESSPVLSSKDIGPINGRVLMGRIIDASFEEKIGRALGEQVFLVTNPADIEIPAGESRQTDGQNGHYAIPFTYKEENGIFVIHYPIYDTWGRPLFSFRIHADMDAFNILERATEMFFLLLTLGFMLLGAIFYYLIHRLVVRRVGDISVKTGEIVNFDDLSRRIPQQFSDEITHLCDNINKMLLRLQEENHKREEIERTMMLNEKLVFLGTVTSKIAHEVNNPLFAIENSFRHLVNHLPRENEKLNRVVSMMEKEIRRVRNITRDMHQYSVRQMESFSQSSLNTVIANAIDVVTWSKLLKGSTVHFPGRDRSLPLYCNPDTLQQVFMNLIVNAVDAMKGSGDIHIRVQDEGDMYRVDVADTGPGIEDEIKALVFAPFQTTKQGKGAGLGLNICQTIVANHGGSIEAGDNHPKGACFTIRLPKQNKQNLTPGPKGGNSNGTES